MRAFLPSAILREARRACEESPGRAPGHVGERDRPAYDGSRRRTARLSGPGSRAIFPVRRIADHGNGRRCEQSIQDGRPCRSHGERLRRRWSPRQSRLAEVSLSTSLRRRHNRPRISQIPLPTDRGCGMLRIDTIVSDIRGPVVRRAYSGWFTVEVHFLWSPAFIV